MGTSLIGQEGNIRNGTPSYLGVQIVKGYQPRIVRETSIGVRKDEAEKGDRELLKQTDDAEKLLRSLRKAVSEG